MSDIIDFALDALSLGPIFPVANGKKIPVYPGGCRDATRSRSHVMRHWTAHPNDNYGIATGDGFFVIDSTVLRAQRRGNPLWRSMVRCAQQSASSPRTADTYTSTATTCLSATVWVSWVPALMFGAMVATWWAPAAYTLPAYYRHADGHDPGSLAMAPAPLWLLQLVRKPEPPQPTKQSADQNRPKGKHNSRYGQTALAGELQRLASAPLHQRNHTLNQCAFRLGQLIAAGYLSEAEVVRELEKTATTIGLDTGEIPKTIRSGIDAGKRLPRPKSPPANSISKRWGVPATTRWRRYSPSLGVPILITPSASSTAAVPGLLFARTSAGYTTTASAGNLILPESEYWRQCGPPGTSPLKRPT